MFERLRERLDSALADLAHVIEHVGSTSVPGLDAKPIIDVDVVVADESSVAPAIKALAAVGWRHQADLGSEAGRRSCRRLPAEPSRPGRPVRRGETSARRFAGN